MLKGECKKLFVELRDFSDNLNAMNEFVNLIKEFVDWNRGDIRIGLIDLNKYGFPIGEMLIVYNDMGGWIDNQVFRPFKFVDYMIEVFDEYDDEKYLEDFWIPRLRKLIKENDY